MERYHFVTNWFFQAPIERVWEEIVDIPSWPSWWASWEKAASHGSASQAQLGSVVDHEVRGDLPYSLRFRTVVTVFQSPHLLEIKSSGDLVGTGALVLKPRDQGTAVTYSWDVGLSNPLLNLLGKLSFTRALMEKNHDFVMEEGYRGLKIRVEGENGLISTGLGTEVRAGLVPATIPEGAALASLGNDGSHGLL